MLLLPYGIKVMLASRLSLVIIFSNHLFFNAPLSWHHYNTILLHLRLFKQREYFCIHQYFTNPGGLYAHLVASSGSTDIILSKSNFISCWINTSCYCWWPAVSTCLLKYPMKKAAVFSVHLLTETVLTNRWDDCLQQNRDQMKQMCLAWLLDSHLSSENTGFG